MKQTPKVLVLCTLSTGLDSISEVIKKGFTISCIVGIAEKKIDLVKTWDSIVNSSQRYQPVEDTDIDDNETIPMNENASQVSFDNFEKENASEKKRKKSKLNISK